MSGKELRVGLPAKLSFVLEARLFPLLSDLIVIKVSSINKSTGFKRCRTCWWARFLWFWTEWRQLLMLVRVSSWKSEENNVQLNWQLVPPKCSECSQYYSRSIIEVSVNQTASLLLWISINEKDVMLFLRPNFVCCCFLGVMYKSKNYPQNSGSQLVIEEPEHEVDKVVKCSGGQENREGEQRKLPKIKIPAKIWKHRRQQIPAHTAGETQQSTTAIHLNKDGHCVSTTVRSKFLRWVKIQIQIILFLD